MLYLYLFTGIAGFIVLTASTLLGGDDQDGDGVSADKGFDKSFEKADHDGDSSWLGFFSFRSMTYFFGFFGMTGSLLTWLTEEPEWMRALLSVGVGAASAVGARLLLSKAVTGTTGSLGTQQLQDLVGKEARVLIDVGPGATGQVRVQMPDGATDVLAVAQDEAIEAGARVVVVEVAGDKLLVAKHPVGDANENLSERSRGLNPRDVTTRR